MNKENWDDICMWKDLFYLTEAGYGTTFDGYEGWGSDKDLYQCVFCDGYDFFCRGYKSMKSISRMKNK